MNKIGPKEKKVDSKKCIPQSWRIHSSGHHFYRYGISQYRNGCIDRSKLYHPLLVFILPLVLEMKFFYSAVTTEKSFDFHLLIGDLGYILGLKFHINAIAVIYSSMASLTQMINFYHFCYRIGQTYMNVFNMISGQITPHSIGLSDDKIIKNIIKYSKTNFKTFIIIQKSANIATFLYFSHLFFYQRLVIQNSDHSFVSLTFNDSEFFLCP